MLKQLLKQLLKTGCRISAVLFLSHTGILLLDYLTGPQLELAMDVVRSDRLLQALRRADAWVF